LKLFHFLFNQKQVSIPDVCGKKETCFFLPPKRNSRRSRRFTDKKQRKRFLNAVPTCIADRYDWVAALP